MALQPGTRIGPYDIQSALGAGGMGEVYRATDTNLGRQVAIKVLPGTFAHDPERLSRFEREAKTLASLSHPNIAAVYGLEKADGTRALVMELVEGPTLADRIAQGPIPVDEALSIAKQIAEALEAAHEQGIIHRDLKPANIKVRPEGSVKVLDFGLAKALEPIAAGSIDAAASPTITSPAVMTGAGVLLGTAAYMSPEQARGNPVDRRADIWAFGCVLYEMLTGRQAFAGDSISDSIACILTKQPDWTSLPPGVPALALRLLRRCLEKNVRERLHDIGDARLDIADALHPEEKPTAPRGARQLLYGQRAASLAAGLLVGAVASGTAVWLASRPAPSPLTRLSIAFSGDQALVVGGLDRDFTLSPDGTHVVYIGLNGSQMFVRRLDSLDSTPLGELGAPRGLFTSPDGTWVGFFNGVGTLRKIPIAGGRAITLCECGVGPRGATWGRDGTIVLAGTDPTSGLLRVSDAGGDPEVLTKPTGQEDDREHLWPEFLPGGNAVLFTIVPNGGAERARVAVLDLRTGARKILIQGGSHAHYVPSGHLVYVAGNELRAVAFDVDRMEVIGGPIPVVPQVATTADGGGDFDVSTNGTLVYVSSTGAALARTLAWVDRNGREELIRAPARAYTYPRISPDGTRVALGIRDLEQDIWIWDFARETLSRFTFGPTAEWYPLWTPDGRRLIFDSGRSGSQSLYWQAANGAGAAERLTQSPYQSFPTSVSPDGRHIVFRINGRTQDIALVTLGEKPQVAPLIQTEFQELNGEVSPDGRWLAYESSESGVNEIYVCAFPDVTAGRWQISSGGGSRPLWARRGDELFFLGPTGIVMGVRVDTTTTWTAGPPAKVLDGRSFFVGGGGSTGRTYDISPDGQRFLMIKAGTSEQNSASVVVVQNWTEELKRLVPVP